MHKIEKFLAVLDKKRQARVRSVLAKILKNDLEGLDVKKIKGASREFRVRVGDMRILFSDTDSGIYILSIEFRSDTTYT